MDSTKPNLASLPRWWAERPSDLRLVVYAWAASRLLLLSFALVLSIDTGVAFADLIGNWDVAHFVSVAKNGYAQPTDMAFFPGMPLLLAPAFALKIPVTVWGMLVCLPCSLAAVVALLRLGGRWAALAWLLAPTAVFTLVAYSEAPFCAAAFWAWERGTKKQWLSAGVLAGVASLFRVSGLFLFGALVVLAFFQHYKEGMRALWLALRPLIIPVVVLFDYALYLYGKTGKWTAWTEAQSAGWQRQFTMPWDAIAHHWTAIQPGMYADHPGWVEVFRAEFACWWLGLGVAVWLLVRRKWAESSWIGVQVLAFSLSFWFQSVVRAVLLWFPLWTELGAFVDNHRSGRWRFVWPVVALVALAVQLWWAWLFYTGRWAG